MYFGGDTMYSYKYTPENCTNFVWRQLVDLLWYRFVMYINVKSLCYIPETKIMLYVNVNKT